MFCCNMISWLWIIMTIAINNAYIVSGESRRYPRRASRSCEARRVDNPCQNGGRCHVTLSADDAEEPALVTCHCPPAWTGAVCELERDPCTDGSAVCGPGWSCVRNSSNIAAGYDCGCGGRPGWQRFADGLPRCVDIDECALLAPACFNGGRCRNKAGSYECDCKPGYSGDRCELGAPPSTLSADGWRDWSAWSRCEGRCGDGQQTRSRICGRRRAGCTGDPEQSRTCVPRRCRGDDDEDGDRDDDVEEEGDEEDEQGSSWIDRKDKPPWGRGRKRRKTHRRKAHRRNASASRHGRKENELFALDDTTDPDSKDARLRQWRDTRTTNWLTENWKLLHYLGYEPVRAKRSLAQIESYDDLELALMRHDPRTARDLGAEEHSLERALRSSEFHKRYRKSSGHAPIPDEHSHRDKRSTDIAGIYHENILGSLDDIGISVSSHEPGDPDHSQTVANLKVAGHTGILRVRQNMTSPSDSSLEEALRRPAAAVRALVGPVVGRARAALLRLRLAEAARAEQQEAAVAAAEAAERTLRQLQKEVQRRASARKAAEHRLWQLLEETEAAAKRGAEAQRSARTEVKHREAAETRLEAERRRRRQLRQDEAAAAAQHAAIRASLLRRVEAVRKEAVEQSHMLSDARRRVDVSEERANQAADERRQQLDQLRQLQESERQKLLEVQRHGAEQLSAALREAEGEERRAQEAEHSRKQAEHQVRPDPEPPPLPASRHREVQAGVQVTV